MFPSATDAPAARAFARSWARRASVRRHGHDVAAEDDGYDPSLPDYPIEMVPFRDHDAFRQASPDQVQRVLTLAWLVYNQRTITAEERIANPAFALVKDGRLPGLDGLDMHQAVLQSLIDEHFHTLMHLTAMHATCRRRGLAAPPVFPDAITYRSLCHTLAGLDDQADRDLAVFAYAVVAEISVNAYLDLIAKNDRIQPAHTRVAAMHNHDEFMHASLLIDVAAAAHAAMNDRHRRRFVELLPQALTAFAAHDFSAWNTVLTLAGIPDADRIVRETAEARRGAALLRDYSGLRRLAVQLDILNDLDFDFGPAA